MAKKAAAAAPVTTAAAVKTTPAVKTAPVVKAAPAAKTAAVKAPAAKKTTAKATPAPVVAASANPAGVVYEVGQRVEFVGYSEADMPEDQKILVPGQILIVTVAKGEDGYEAVIENSEPPMGDTVFPEEIKAAPTTKAGAAAAAKTEKLNTPPISKADAKAAKNVTKAKAAPVVAPPAADVAPAAKGKGKAKAAAAEPANAAPQAATKAIEGTVVQIQDTAAVAAALKGQDALKAAKALAQQSEEIYFTLGGVLNHIYNEGLHKLAGFEGKRGFAEYVEKELGVQYRKAMYLINIYAYFRSLGVDEKRLAEIGWSKAKELVGKVDAAGFDDMVTFASSHSREELQNYIKTSTASTGDGDNATRTEKKRFNFVLFGDQAAGVERALGAAALQIEGDPENKQALAFELIVTEWAMTHENVEVTLEQALRAVEARFGVEVGVVEDKVADAETDSAAAATA
jgi:hypothetical protein